MRMADVEAMGREYFVAETLDVGFRNIDVFRTLQKVMDTHRGVRGMESVFRKHLTSEGQQFAIMFCNVWIKDGMWGWLAYSAGRIK